MRGQGPHPQLVGKLQALAEELSYYSRLTYERKLVGAAGGNLSARIPGTNQCLVTATNVSLRDVAPENLVLVDVDGTVLESPSGRKPSKEISFHLAIFRARPRSWHAPRPPGTGHWHAWHGRSVVAFAPWDRFDTRST